MPRGDDLMPPLRPTPVGWRSVVVTPFGGELALWQPKVAPGETA
jgi:hypothetical protein